MKFSIERTYDPNVKTLVASVFTTVSRIETPDPGTVVIHTKASDPLLPARLAFYGGQIIPKKHLEQVGNDTFNAKPVGTGPLRFVSWAKDDSLVLEANPDYWGGRIDVDRVVFRPSPRSPRAWPASSRARRTSSPSSRRTTGTASTRARPPRAPRRSTPASTCLGTNSKVPPLNNWTLKKAMQLGVDREAIVKELWRGRGIIPTGPIAKGDAHFDPSLPPLAYDPGKAKELVKQSGYKGEPIYLETTVGLLANDKAMSEAIAAMWKDVGINVVVEVVEFSVRAQKNRERTFKGLWWSDPTSTLRDPDGMMWRLMAPGGPHDYWRHPEFDELGTSARNSMDEVFRAKAYKRMTELFLEFNPWILVIQPNEDYGLQKFVEFARTRTRPSSSGSSTSGCGGRSGPRPRPGARRRPGPSAPHTSNAVPRPLFPTTVIGSLPRPAWVRDVILDRKAGRLAEAEADRLLDPAIDTAIRLQERAGLDEITDGEWRRESYVKVFAERVRGFRPDLNPSGGLPYPAVVAPIEYHREIAAPEVRYARARTRPPRQGHPAVALHHRPADVASRSTRGPRTRRARS